MKETVSLGKLKNYLIIKMETHFIIFIILKEVKEQVCSVKGPIKIGNILLEIFMSFKLEVTLPR